MTGMLGPPGGLCVPVLCGLCWRYPFFGVLFLWVEAGKGALAPAWVTAGTVPAMVFLPSVTSLSWLLKIERALWLLCQQEVEVWLAGVCGPAPPGAACGLLSARAGGSRLCPSCELEQVGCAVASKDGSSASAAGVGGLVALGSEWRSSGVSFPCPFCVWKEAVPSGWMWGHSAGSLSECSESSGMLRLAGA